ncbi:MAG: hypothetical protein K0R57_5720 [Paenibacillaceae bacterium]|jgi:LacI family transcriptional regulator|nr:hypothetical protein [Paenibacillaceae bacterium]
MPRKKAVTLQNLADELGLTIQTVSKALRGLPGMSEKTRSEVMQLARSKGYLTRGQLESMSSDRLDPFPVAKRRFLLLLGEASLNYNVLLMEGLRERFHELGHTVEALVLPERWTEKEYVKWVKDSGVLYADGVFIAPRLHPSLWEQRLLNLPVPRILLNYPPAEERVDSVVWDVYEAVFQSVRHLARLGHRKILYVGDISSQRGYTLRWQAFREAMGELDQAVTPSGHATLKRDGTPGWLEHFCKLYISERPTAVLCGIDEETPHIFRELARLDAPVPRTCSLVALVNMQHRDLPILTRPLLLIKESGYRAADRMLWRIANPRLPYEHIRIMGEIFYGSTAASRDNSAE